MRFSTLLTAALSATFVLALPYISSEADPEHDLVARGRPGTGSSEEGRGGEPILPAVAFQPAEENGHLPTIKEVSAQKPKFVYRENLPQSDRFPEGETVIVEHVDNPVGNVPGTHHMEVGFGKDMANPGSGQEYVGKANPKLQRSIYRSPKGKTSIAREQKRRAAVNRLSEVTKGKEARLAAMGGVAMPHMDDFRNHDALQAVAVKLYDHEAKQMNAVGNQINAAHQANPDMQVTFHDNRGLSNPTPQEQAQPIKGPNVDGFESPEVSPLTPTSGHFNWDSSPPSPMEQQSPNFDTVLANRPPSGGSEYGPPIADQFDLLDVSGTTSYRKHKRDNPITSIQGQEGNSQNGVTNDTNDLSASFQLYLSAFDSAQSNVSALLFPFLDAIMNGTNSSIVYDAAWSIFSDLTGSGPYVIGPFFHGTNCLDWIEDQLFANYTSINLNSTSTSLTAFDLNSTSTSSSGPYANSTSNATALALAEEIIVLEYLAVHQVLLDLYNYAWTNGSSTANATGLLADMASLSNYLWPNDTSIAGAYWNSSTPTYDLKYFTTYNINQVPDQTLGNVSFPAVNGTGNLTMHAR